MLIEKGLSEKSAFKYILWDVVLGVIGIEVASYVPREGVNGWDYIDSILAILIPMAGTFFAYRSNGGDTGKDFVARYISIGFVMAIRFLLFLVPVTIIFIAYTASVFDDNAEIYTTPFEIALFSVWYIALYYSIAKHIGDVAKAQ